MYNDLTPELVEARRVAVELTNEYNASYGQPPEIREPLLRKILGEMGEDVFFEPSFRCEFGYNIKILDPGGIEIGDNVLFSPRVSIYTANHAFDVKESHQRYSGKCGSGRSPMQGDQKKLQKQISRIIFGFWKLY